MAIPTQTVTEGYYRGRDRSLNRHHKLLRLEDIILLILGKTRYFGRGERRGHRRPGTRVNSGNFQWRTNFARKDGSAFSEVRSFRSFTLERTKTPCSIYLSTEIFGNVLINVTQVTTYEN